MATIKYTLPGLSPAGSGMIEARSGALPHMWTADIVLPAHAGRPFSNAAAGTVHALK